MSLNTDTYLEIKKFLDEALGDSIEVDTTTNIGANNTIVSTQLKAYDKGETGYFDDWWVDITEGNNIAVKRLTGSTAYVTATGTLVVYGAALAAETGAVTFRMHRFDPNIKENALKRAIEEVYPSIHKKVDDLTIVTGNILPDGHFENWSSATALNFYTTTNITLARTSTAGLTRGGYYSAKATAGADNGYFSVHSNNYPRLLQLQDQTVDFYVQAYPEVANDASIVIYTKQADGTAQTLTSTTTCPAGEFTKLKLETQTLNDDLVEVELRFKVATNTKYVYFDDAYLSGMRLSEYLLPPDFINGNLRQVFLQTYGISDEIFYDLHPFQTSYPGEQIPFEIIDNGTNKYLKLLNDCLSERRLRLKGDKPLESLSAYTDTLTIDSERMPLLIAKAREIFWKRESAAISGEDRARLKGEAMEAENDYRKLLTKMRMPRDVEYIRRAL